MRLRVKVALVALAVISVCLSLLSTLARGVTVGADMTAAWWQETPSAQWAELVHLHQMGGRVTRVEDPGPPYVSDTQIENLLQAAYSLHIKVFLGTGLGNPAALKRYPHEIIGVEVGNEPNNPAFFPGTACDYVRDLRIEYLAVKSVDPHITVVGGSVALTDANYVQQLLRCGARRWMDVLSVHPYSVEFTNFEPYALWGPPVISEMTPVEMVWHGPIWITEFGYPASVPSAGTWDKLAVSEYSNLSYIKLISLYCLTGPFAVPTL